MAGERRLFQRQLGGYSTAGYPLASAGATWGHQPATFQRDVCADVAFLKRLKITSELEGHSGPVSTLDWNAEGTLLLSGSDDCKVNIWDVSRSRAQHSIDSGHTAVVYAAKFLPNTNDEHIITCSADRQVRLINLQKSAIRPFNVHRGKVKALAIMDQHVFLSGSEDGTVRRFDTRIAPQAGNQGQPGSQDSAYVLADQRQERHARNNRAKVGVNSLSIDPMRPHLFITGGSDPLVRLFDQRMISVADPTERSSSRRPQWISCYVPTHLKASLQQVQRSAFGPPVRSYNVTSATFSHSGDEVFASYSAEQIYCFRAVDHARSSASMAAAVEGQTRQAPVQHSRTRPSSGRRQAEGASFTAARASAAGQRAGPAAQAGEGGQAAAAAARTSREQRQALQQLVQQRITRHAARQASQADALPGAGSAPAAQDRHGMAATAAAMAEAEAMAEADAAAAATTAAMEVDDAAGMEQRPPVQPTLASLTEQADAPASPWQGFRDRFRFRRGQERTQQGQADAPQTSTEAQGTPDVQPPSSGEAAAGPSRAAGAEGAAGRTSSLGLLRRHSLSFLGWPAAQAESPQAQNAPGIGTAEPQAGAAPGGRPRAAQSATDIATNQAQGCTAPAADDAALNSDAAMQDGDAHRRSKRKAEESAPTPDSRPATRGRLARRSADEHAASTSNAASHLATGCVAAAPAVPAGPVSQTEQSQPAVDPTRRAASGLVAAAEPAVHARAPSSQQAQLAGTAADTMLLGSVSQQVPQRAASAGLMGEVADSAQREANISGEHQQQQPQPPRRREPPRGMGSSLLPSQPPRAHIALSTLAGEGPAFAVAGAGGQDHPTASTGTSRPPVLPGEQDAHRRQQRSRLASIEENSTPTASDSGLSGLHEQQAVSPAPHPDRAGLAALSGLALPTAAAAHRGDSLRLGADASQTGTFGMPAAATAATAGAPAIAGSSGGPQSHARPRGRAAAAAAPATADSSQLHGSARHRSRPPNGLRSGFLQAPLSRLAQSSASTGEAEQNATGTQFAVREGLGLAARPAGTAAAAPGGVQPAGTAAEQRPAAEERQRQAHELSVLDIANAVVDHMEASLRAGQLPSEFSMEADFLLPFERPARRRRLDGGPAASIGHAAGASQRASHGQTADAANAAAGATSQPAADASAAGGAPTGRQTRASAQAPAAASAPAPQQAENGAAASNSLAAEVADADADGGRMLLAGRPPRSRRRAAAHSPTRALSDGPGRAEARGGGRAEQRPGGRARDANVGAICQDDDEGDEEEVEECGMFQTRYTGHRNMMSAKQVALMGGHSEYVVSGSDDGRVFVWNRYTGALVNLLQSDADDADVHAVNCVAPHPIAPMLATAGAQPIVKLWSPEAEDMATLENAEAVMRTNAAELAEGERAAAQRPLWLNMTMGNVRRNMQRGDAEDDLDRVTPAGVRCSIM